MKNIKMIKMKFNAKTFKYSLVSGHNNLYNFYKEINKLNVFPIPDGDTGTNMNLTMNNAIKEINKINSKSIINIADVFAHGLIMGARGNSGVILSQIFRGFANGLKKFDKFNFNSIKAGILQANEVAYKAVMKPVEGTILTVIREIAEHILILKKEISIPDLFQKIVDFANESLNNTPELLPVLKEAGVVDSGGFGLVKIFEGITKYWKTGKIVLKQKKQIKNISNNININLQNENFGYCTEVIVILNINYINKINIIHIRQIIEDQGGKSIIVVIDNNILKVHIHILFFGYILNFLQKYGEFKNIKIENMNLQVSKHVKTIKVDRKLNNSLAIIAVTPSNDISNFFKNDLNIQFTINSGYSMNPSTDDYLNAIETVDAVDVFILPNNSNAILSAQQAAKVEQKSNIYIVPTTSIQEGMVAALSFEPQETSKKIFSILKSSIKNVISLSITVSIKKTLINGIKINKGEYIGIINKKIICSFPTLLWTIKYLFDITIKKTTEIVTIFVGEEVDIQDINIIKKYLDDSFDVEYEFINGNQKLYPILIAIE